MQFFSRPLRDAYIERAGLASRHVDSLPDSDFDQVTVDLLCKRIVALFEFPEFPRILVGEIGYEQPEFLVNSGSVEVTVHFPFSGDGKMFELFNRTVPVPLPNLQLQGRAFTKVYQIAKGRMHELDDQIDAQVQIIEKYGQTVREAIPSYNDQLAGTVAMLCGQRIMRIGENKRAAVALSNSKFTVKKRTDGTEQIIVPVQRKPIEIVHPQKAVGPSLEYAIEMAEYDSILMTITSMVTVAEMSPVAFTEMNEEALRTIILVGLNANYEGQATGETFNGHGKTDILIRRENRNVFIAECLMWKGPKYLQKKMDEQLFQYAMWRDSKLALIVFNRGGDFAKTIESMKETIGKHPQKIKQLEWRHESGARYQFRRHDDPDRQFVLTALAFDIPATSSAKPSKT